MKRDLFLVLKYPWFSSNEDVKISPDVMEKFDIFAKRGILQKALTPLMLEHVRGVDKHLIEYAQNLHKNTVNHQPFMIDKQFTSNQTFVFKI